MPVITRSKAKLSCPSINEGTSFTTTTTFSINEHNSSIHELPSSDTTSFSSIHDPTSTNLSSSIFQILVILRLLFQNFQLPNFPMRPVQMGNYIQNYYSLWKGKLYKMSLLGLTFAQMVWLSFMNCRRHINLKTFRK
jgi:hypothetical protein